MSAYGEMVRLSNELRSRPAKQIILHPGKTVTRPARNGFDIETASINQLLNHKLRSPVQREFINLLINMKSGKIPEDLEKLGKVGWKS